MSFFKKLKLVFGAGAVDRRRIEEVLINADFGPHLVSAISGKISANVTLQKIISEIIGPHISKIPFKFLNKPTVIMLVGVNGSGKTTSIAKLAEYFQQQGNIVDIAACDTFRAAATEQLFVWANKLGCNIFKSDNFVDPASVAYSAFVQTKADVLLVDTAGRLPNNANLMNELSKICSVLKKIDSSAPHHTYLTIDATTGQNMISQAQEFGKITNISGIILNKTDGNAKGGAIVRIVNELKIPIVAVGNGEKLEDLKEFSLQEFLQDLI